MSDTEPADLAEGIGRALSGATPLPDGDACQRYARDRFSWRHVAEQTRAVVDAALPVLREAARDAEDALVALRR